MADPFLFNERMPDYSFYPTCLSDTEWNLIKPLLPDAAKRGRKPKNRRLVLNAIFYILRGGNAWRLLPKEFGPWSTIYDIYRRWSKNGTWNHIHDSLRDMVRRAAGKSIQPSAAALDSQSVKTPEGGPCGYDAGKNIKGRKRHLLVDTLGLLLAVCVTPASLQDRDGAVELLSGCFMRYWRLAVVWADAVYGGDLIEWVKGLRPFGRLHLEVVRKPKGQKTFSVLPKRWIVERTFGWLVKCRRLRCDYERKTTHSEAFILIAMSGVMLRRLARQEERKKAKK